MFNGGSVRVWWGFGKVSGMAHQRFYQGVNTIFEEDIVIEYE